MTTCPAMKPEPPVTRTRRRGMEGVPPDRGPQDLRVRCFAPVTTMVAGLAPEKGPADPRQRHLAGSHGPPERLPGCEYSFGEFAYVAQLLSGADQKA